MERVETLLQKMQEQISAGASVNQLLQTVQMLQHELLHLKGTINTSVEKESVAVSMPVQMIPALPATEDIPEAAAPTVEEKTVEILQVDEAEIEAELEEIKRNAATIHQISSQSKPSILFSLAEDEIPTLPQNAASITTTANGKEINDSIGVKEITSMNDALKKPTIELSERLNETSIKDLKKAIGINDRFLYINELFRGDEVMYERSIKTINGFAIWPEAEYWIRRELKTKLGWTDSEPTVMQFDQLIKRRFS